MESKKTCRRVLAGAAVLFLALGPSARAQDETGKMEVGRWYKSLEAGLNLSQSAYSDNWAGGDRGQLTWTFIVNGDARRRLNEKANWSHVLKLAYGQTTQQDASRDWSRPDKSTDRIDYETIMRFTLGLAVDPYVSGRLESQFQDASDPLGRSLNFNPIFLKQSAGVAREFIGEEKRALLVRFGGTFREAIRKQFTSELDPADETTQTETGIDGGLELVVDHKNVLFDEAIAWTSKLSFFQPLFYSSKSDLEDLDPAALTALGIDPDVADFTTTMDVDWENIFTGQLTKYLSVNLYVRWVYDKYDTSVKPLLADDGSLANPGAVLGGIRKAGQFKQTLGLGLTYRFF